jgi:23S rRNA (cytosine1962-C5)-methyltransferase
MNSTLPYKVFLKKNKGQSLKRFHPWIFSGAIGRISGNPNEGDLVEVYDEQEKFLALGHYQPDSISVRILTFQQEPIDAGFWKRKVHQAVQLRKTLGFFSNPDTNVFRLVHGEGDEMPGIIADYYNGVLVLQCHSAGMYLQLNEITEAFKDELGDLICAIYNKSLLTLPHKFMEKKEDGFLWGMSENPVHVLENGHRFLIDFIEGQKTGFFIDQRENRKLLSLYAKEKSIANLFSFTGGFSVYAACAGAKKVISVDSSAKALELASANYTLNNLSSNVENKVADVMSFFQQSDEKYDIIILDPPAFAKHHVHRERALVAYKNLNAKAIRLINSGGFLFSFSCSQAITADDLRQAIFVAAASEKRHVSIIHQLHQPTDHPVSIFHPEGEYLKGFVLYVK